MQSYLVNILIFTGIVLVMLLIAVVIQLIIVMADYQRVSKRLNRVTSVVDFISARGLLKSSTVMALAAGVKKGVSVLFRKKKEG